MIDMKWIRNDPEKVKENIRKKFQDEKLPLVDEVVELDKKFREAKVQGDELRSQRKSISKKIGALMGQGKKEEAEAVKAEVGAIGTKLEELEKAETELSARIREIMLVIPNFIDDSVPIGKDDSENVEVERFGEPVVPDFEVPYHVDIMEKLNGIDIDAARDTSGNGFYYLCGDIARLHSSILAYARDFMINKGFTYYIPPFMIRSNVVTGVMSFAEMEGSHIQLGVDLCRRYKESPLVINAVEAHHGDVEPESLIACLVQAADTISAARPGARRETLETYTNRLKQLEDITNSYKGVEKSFAIQAGREVRVMVVPEVINDSDMVLLARDISKQIEDQMEYPGQIKVSIVRESRVVDYAK